MQYTLSTNLQVNASQFSQSTLDAFVQVTKDLLEDDHWANGLCIYPKDEFGFFIVAEDGVLPEHAPSDIKAIMNAAVLKECYYIEIDYDW